MVVKPSEVGPKEAILSNFNFEASQPRLPCAPNTPLKLKAKRGISTMESQEIFTLGVKNTTALESKDLVLKVISLP